jgi:xanthosine utilization system XapX-like protein
MRAKGSSFTDPRMATVAGLVVGATGIAILWASGVGFPVYPPPGMVILAVGALFVALARRSWAPAVGALLGLFVTVGFLISPTGLSNLAGEAGTSVAIGQAMQVTGVLTALIAGVVATWVNHRKPDQIREPRKDERG